MEQLMEWLTQIFGEGADLAAIASAAGVGGGALSVVTAFFFRGFFMKLLPPGAVSDANTGATPTASISTKKVTKAARAKLSNSGVMRAC